MTPFTLPEIKELRMIVRNFFRSYHVEFLFYQFDADLKELFVVYACDQVQLNRTLNLADIMKVLQFDVSIWSYDASFIKDEDGNRLTYEEYFDTCPAVLLLDFVVYDIAIDVLNDRKTISLNQTQAA